MHNSLNDLNVSSNNICLSESSVSNIKTNPETNSSPTILNQLHCKGHKSKSQVHDSQGHIRNSHAPPEKAWNSYTGYLAQEMTNKSVLYSHSTTKSKVDKYKFPAVDPPAVDGLLKYSPKELYIYIINLIYHRLTPDTYKLWCELTERDVCFPEISKNGVLESSYSLKH